jgi:hypothetical protein
MIIIIVTAVETSNLTKYLLTFKHIRLLDSNKSQLHPIYNLTAHSFMTISVLYFCTSAINWLKSEEMQEKKSLFFISCVHCSYFKHWIFLLSLSQNVEMGPLSSKGAVYVTLTFRDFLQIQFEAGVDSYRVRYVFNTSLRCCNIAFEIVVNHRVLHLHDDSNIISPVLIFHVYHSKQAYTHVRTQSREHNWGDAWKDSSGSGLENQN